MGLFDFFKRDKGKDLFEANADGTVPSNEKALSIAVRRDRMLFRAGLRMLAAHQFATLAKSLVKDAVDRSRPGEAIDSRRYRMAPGDSKDHRLQSMPSGHSAGVVNSAAQPSRSPPVRSSDRIVRAGATAAASARK